MIVYPDGRFPWRVGMESFYGSVPNFSFAKSTVLKPTRGRISRKNSTVPLCPLRRHRSITLCNMKNNHLRVLYSQRHLSWRAVIRRPLQNVVGLKGKGTIRCPAYDRINFWNQQKKVATRFTATKNVMTKTVPLSYPITVPLARPDAIVRYSFRCNTIK